MTQRAKNIYFKCNILNHVNVMFGPSQVFWPSSTSRLSRALVFSTMSYYGHRDMLIALLICPVLILLGLCLTKLYIQISLRFENDCTWSTLSEGFFPGMLRLGPKTLFGLSGKLSVLFEGYIIQCLGYHRTIFLLFLLPG